MGLGCVLVSIQSTSGPNSTMRILNFLSSSFPSFPSQSYIHPTMESLSLVVSSSPPIQNNHPKPLKSLTLKPNSHHPPPPPLPKPSFTHLPKTSLSLTTLHLLTSLPTLASETLTSPTNQVSEKISLESILVSIDDFFNRNPFFVGACTFIWLVVIPLTQEYFRNYKFISAIDGFRKLRDDQSVQLLDIRDRRSLVALRSPNLEALNKNVVQVEFLEGDEDGFLKNVLDNIRDPGNTVLCIMDNFDGNSMRVAELLFKNGGFKEAYALKGGVRGKKGWLAIQDTLLPPTVHMYPKKKKSRVSQSEITGIVKKKEERTDTSSLSSIEEIQRVGNGHVNKSTECTSPMKVGSRSPYPNYPDLKPPSSPSP